MAIFHHFWPYFRTFRAFCTNLSAQSDISEGPRVNQTCCRSILDTLKYCQNSHFSRNRLKLDKIRLFHGDQRPKIPPRTQFQALNRYFVYTYVFRNANTQGLPKREVPWRMCACTNVTQYSFEARKDGYGLRVVEL